jgi:hypothetical protein
MRKSTILATAAALLAAAWWHWPAAAQRTPQPADAEQVISFEQYREFRMHDLEQRRERLAHQLAVPGLTTAEKASIERRKSYWDQLAAMSAEQRDQLFREGSTRSTPITMANLTARNAPRGARSNGSTTGNKRRNAPIRATTNASSLAHF